MKADKRAQHTDWLKIALASLRQLADSPRDLDDSEISPTAITQAEHFLRDLAREEKTDNLMIPYVGAGSNGQVVVNWVNQSDRIDLEFNDDNSASVAVILDGHKYSLGRGVKQVAESVRKVCKTA